MSLKSYVICEHDRWEGDTDRMKRQRFEQNESPQRAHEQGTNLWGIE